MTKKTLNRRVTQLVTELNNHPYKEELLNIMQQQMLEDTVIVDTNTKV